jgi:hypothetical protein
VLCGARPGTARAVSSCRAPGRPGAQVGRWAPEVAKHGWGACEAGALAFWACWARPHGRSAGVRAELAWLGRAEQACQDAGDEIWVAVREFLGGRQLCLRGQERR